MNSAGGLTESSCIARFASMIASSLCPVRDSRCPNQPDATAEYGSSIRARWEAGYVKTMRALDEAPWEAEVDPLEGVVLHEPKSGIMEAAE